MQVVAYDEDKDTIEVQVYETGVTEFDLASWNQLDIELIEPPENLSGPVDEMLSDDIGRTERFMHRLTGIVLLTKWIKRTDA